MKNQNMLFFLGISVVFILFVITSNQAIAQNEPEENLTGAVSDAEEYQEKTKQPFDTNEIEVLLQLVLRNKEGQLLAYVETEEKRGIRPWYLDRYLDKVTDNKIITKDGKRYELIQFEKYEPPAVKSKYSMAMYVLMGPGPPGENAALLWMNHDAYQIEPGDKLKVYYTIYRPI